jgi:predicted RNase H-like nuclease (RuvC/YqgF family)
MSSDIANTLNGATRNIRMLNHRMKVLTSTVNNINNINTSLQNSVDTLQKTMNGLQKTLNGLQTTVDDLQICKINKAGDTMDGNLDMNNNNIINTSLINNFNMSTLDNNLTLLSIDVNNKVDKP